MNTPRSKKPKRYGHAKIHTPPEGHLKTGIDDERYISALGKLVVGWPQLEEAMVFVMADLLGGVNKTPARQVFHSVQSVSARVKIMRQALEESAVNKSKSEWYDVVIDEFRSLNDIRNKFVHGLWWTGVESGNVYIAQQSTSDVYILDEIRPARLKEIDEALARMGMLWQKITFERPGHELHTSREKS